MTIATDIHADLITPLGAYLRLRRGAPASFLLESVEKGRLGRYSLVGAGARLVDFEQAEVELAAGRPVVGYLGYDHIAKLEPTVPLPGEGAGLPESRFVVAETLVRFDHAASVAEVLAGDRDAVAALLEQDLPDTPSSAAPRGRTQRFPAREEYEEGVLRAKEHIVAGDAFQIVLSQRAERPTNASALALYRSLRRINPSPYHFLLDLDGIALVGSSPETLVKLEGGEVTLRPIAGTRRRGKDPDDDARLEAELRADPKENAEHVMLVDLGRNDVGRVSTVGSVRVTALKTVERYSHVMHLVSEVKGRLAKGLSAVDVLRAGFPAGTVSGSPKVRAMEIIDELEPARRGPYAGAVGYFDRGGDMEMCIVIRTLMAKGRRVSVQAGGGLVYDSVPEAEYQETLSKARAVFTAVAQAEGRVLDAVARPIAARARRARRLGS